MNQFLESARFDIRQTSLNHRQTIPDADGVLRIVISHHDPGVPNWLDTTNYVDGLIGGRYILPESTPDASLRTVEFSKIRDYLPAATPTVSPQERAVALHTRKRSLQARLPKLGSWM
jgi:hypothetical protein